MAARVLRRAAALGLVAATAVSVHALATWKPPVHLMPYNPSPMEVLESAVALHAALRRARPLSGEHLRSLRAQAERDLVLVDASRAEGGDPAAADDLRLLLALLAVRDGRDDDALQLYEQAASDNPFDRRPLALAFYVCLVTDRREDMKRWSAAYRRLVPESEIVDPENLGYESRELAGLMHELAGAASIGGLCSLAHPERRIFPVEYARRTLGAGLAAALEDETLSTAETLQLRALRAYLDSTAQRLLTENAQILMEQQSRGGGAQAAE